MALADELAAAADLVKGKLAGRPWRWCAAWPTWSVTHGGDGGRAGAARREDLFAFGSREAVLAAVLAATGRPDGVRATWSALDGTERADAVLEPASEATDRLADLLRGCCSSVDLAETAAVSADRDRLAALFAPPCPEESLRAEPITTSPVPRPRSPAAPSGASRRDKLASFEAARKKDAAQPDHPAAGHLRRAGRGAARLPGLPVRRRLPGAQRGLGVHRRRRWTAARLRRGRRGARPPATRITSPTAPRSPTPSSRRTSGSTTPVSGAVHQALLHHDDRPAVETLVHNLEHGYTVVWYRDGAPQSGRTTRWRRSRRPSPPRTTTRTTSSSPRPGPRPTAAGFPDGKNVVLTRWTADPNDPADTTKQLGVRQACAAVSGQAIKDFMAKYPVDRAPRSRTAPERGSGVPLRRSCGPAGWSPRRPAP